MIEVSRLETLILKSLRADDEFSRKVLPFIKEEYFSDPSEKLVFKLINGFITKYNTLPSHEAMVIQVGQVAGVKEDVYTNAVRTLSEIESLKDKQIDRQWLTDETEGFCQEKAVHNAIMDAIMIMEGQDPIRTKGMIPQLLTTALGVSFNTNIGHDYLEDWLERFARYREVKTKLPFVLEWFNRITNGGVQPKTLNLCTGGVNVGKTLWLCNLAADYLSQGHEVLYITLEMSQDEISRRIDANLLNVNINDIINLSDEEYEKRIQRIKSMTVGKLIVKEYPTSMASVTDFRALLHDLRLKKGFKPRVIIVDYINICASSRIKLGGKGAGLYEYVKAIAEELRGLMVEFDAAGWTATQVNRTGYKSSDPGMDDTAESFGLPATVDFQFALVTSDELEKLGQLLVKQFKNRYGDVTKNKRFIIGIDRDKQRLFNAEESAQDNVDKVNPSKESVNKFDSDPIVQESKQAGYLFE